MRIAVDFRPGPEIISILRTQRTRSVAARGDGYYRSRLEDNVAVALVLDGTVIGYAALEQRFQDKVGATEFYVRPGFGRYLLPAWEALNRELPLAYLLVRTDDPIATQLCFDLGLPFRHGALYMERESAVCLGGRPGLAIEPLTEATFEGAFAVLRPELPWNGGHSEEDREPMRASIGTFRYHVLLLDGQVVGVGMLTEEEQGLLDVGMVIRQDCRCQGLAAYLISGLASAMEEQGFRVMAGLESTNLASRRALEKAGFRVVYAWCTPQLQDEEVRR